jgi:dTDP-D-glucose 4,6-dehydratase
MRILVTGGAGFIGSAVVRHLVDDTDNEVVVLDKFTYAASLEALPSRSPRETFETGIQRTIEWYLEKRGWWQAILSKRYDGARLGLRQAAS